MSRKQKLLEKLLSKPKDFKWNELVTLLNGYGYKKIKGKGSRRKFFRDNPRDLIILHKPHPGKILLDWAVDEVLKHLKETGDLDGNNKI
jgi:predicted RNA binding protein YcfA (HicA-like mRNA interferase family)